MDLLAPTISHLHVRQILRCLPKEVNDIYDETLTRIDGQVESDRMLAQMVFCWIVHAYRPLSLEELQHALAVSSNMTDMDPGDALVDK